MRIAICDNDHDFAASLRTQILQMPEVVEADCYADVRAREKDLPAGRYDIIFMDIDWGKETGGIDAAAELYRKNDTARIVYVISQIEEFVEQTHPKRTHFAGFLVKPVKQESLERCITDIGSEMKRQSRKVLLVKENGKKVALPQGDIFYLESRGHYVDIVLQEKVFHVLEPMAKIRERLSDEFAQCHRGFLINMNQIHGLGMAEIVMRNGVSVPIGRKYAEEMKTRYFRHIAI